MNVFSSHLLPIRHFGCLVLFVCLAAGLCSAQVDRSGLSGVVRDSSGRLLPQAQIIAVQDSTALRRQTVSDANGNYTIPALPVGVYTITFEHPGFKKLEYLDVLQVIGRTHTLDAIMRVAGAEETLQISAASALIDHNTSAVTGLIEREQANELPLNGRNWASLTAFTSDS